MLDCAKTPLPQGRGTQRALAQEIRHDGVCAHNVYLSPSSSAERRALLKDLARAIREAEANAIVITGDFNLAPRLQDGLFGNQPSTFTKPPERRAFEDLLASASLVDATCPLPGGNLEFTFERVQQGRPNRFRCDLALISSHIAEAAAVMLDHSMKTSPGAFTDHSALIVDVQEQRRRQAVPRAGCGADENSRTRCRARAYRPVQFTASASHKTAINRQSPSQIARKLDQQAS